MKKRIIFPVLGILLLFLAIAHSFGYVQAAKNPPASVSVEYEGSENGNILLSQNERKTVTAKCASAGADSIWQWQVLADMQAGLWVDITGQNEHSMELSYAMLSSVLDVSGGAYIRCEVTVEDETVYSDPISVTISYTPKTTFDPVTDDSSVQKQKNSLRKTVTRASEYVSIVINYRDAVTGNQIFNSHISQIEKGTTFNEVVHSPTFIGFAPYYYSDNWGREHESLNTDINDSDNTDNPEHAASTAESAATVNFAELLGGGTVNADLTVNVYYWAIDVPYAARYFFQNINDDYYTEYANLYYVGHAKTGTIIDDDKLYAHAGNPEGMTPLYHYPESVAADGSTVFECYYDRNYYMMKFDMNGGYGVEPVYARYDTTFVVNEPTRVGYEFLGWDEVQRNADGTYTEGDGNPDTVPNRIPAENKYYKALWKQAETTYTVIYWVENPDDDGYSFFGYNKYSVATGSTVTVNRDLTDADGVEGATDADGDGVTEGGKKDEIKYYTYNDGKSDKNVTVEGDGSTVANVYYDRNEYTLRFFYAKKDSSGNYSVVGGSTYPFGKMNTNDDMDLGQLLNNVTEWGNVTALPVIKTDCKDRYTTGEETYNDQTYYYLSFTGKYGQSLSELWPIDVFESVKITEEHSQCQKLDHAYFSAWNGERKVKYTQENDNETIKGFYQRLDYNLLYHENYEDSPTVNYLGFWDNGAENNWSIPRQWVYQLYIEDEKGTVEHEGIKYSQLNEFITYDDNWDSESGINKQTQTSLLGFTANGRELISSSTIQIKSEDGSIYEMDKYVLRFYYTRNTYSLQLYNHNMNTAWGSADAIPYEFGIGEAIFRDIAQMKPGYPDNLEKNAYYFEGWYTTEDCIPGSCYIRYNKETGTWEQGDGYFVDMPASDLTLFANWLPVTHEVRFFKTYQDMLDYEKNGDADLIYQTSTNSVPNDSVFNILHGNVLGAIDFPTHTESEQELNFSGWFYMKDGVKTMYTPLDLPVVRDLNVFADWGSHYPQPYRIEYKEYGTDTKVADDTFGYAYQGTTRTFTPKAGDPFNQLYEGYNTGWFPTLSSHSITIQAEEDKENPKNNVYTFYYVKANELPYTVRYVNKLTGEQISESKVVESQDKAVVTERFLPIEGMVPDAFYKRLVLSVKVDESGNVITKPEDNVITFYYTPNETASFYAIHYMLQKPDTTGHLKEDYVESDMHTEGTGDIGAELIINPPSITGYTPNEQAILVNGGLTEDSTVVKKKVVDGEDAFRFKVDQEGSELYVYYSLKEYTYTVRYLQYGTENAVSEPKTGDAKQYGTTVTENAIEINGYTAIDPVEKTITIRAYEEGTGTADPNVITFYYITKSYLAEYRVADETGGTLDNESEKVVSQDGTHTFKGAVPTPKAGFEFEGWYLDEECTTKAETSWVDADNRLTPKVEGMEPEPEANIYYAKFKEKTGDLTITRSNAEDEGNGSQVFVYKVTNMDDPEIVVYVTVTGNSSTTIHDLRHGAYAVEQMNGWSWRYGDNTIDVTHNAESTTIDFSKSADKKQWLNGSSAVKVNVKGD